MDIHIRRMTLADLDEIMEIEPVAFGSHHWSRQSFANELANLGGHYYVATSPTDGRLYGYSGFWLIGEEAHITTLAVHPECRRLHVGERLLLNDIYQSNRVGANWMTLEVRVSNEVAQQLYFKYGFKSLGLRRNYYQDNSEDAMVLWTENIHDPEFKALVRQRIAELAGLHMSAIDPFPEDKVPGSKGSPVEKPGGSPQMEV